MRAALPHLIWFAIFLFFLAGCLATAPPASGSSSTVPSPGPPLANAPLPRQAIVFHPSNASVSAEMARTPNQLDRGLMYRYSLGADEGMIFYLPQNDYAQFWMAHTFLPLDLLYLDENRTIIDIQPMAPCTTVQDIECTLYLSRAPALYAIELNQNYSRLHGIQVGDQAQWADP